MSDLRLQNHGSCILDRLDFLGTDELAELENDPDAAVDQDVAESDVEVVDSVTAVHGEQCMYPLSSLFRLLEMSLTS
jgi:hypothetical protein